MKNIDRIAITLVSTVGSLALAVPAVYAAAEQPAGAAAEQPAGAAAASADRYGTSDIVVTATKSRSGTTVQNAALTLSAFGEKQLQAAQANTVNEVAKMMPNVHFAGGAFSTQNNYSVRGMGLYSSIPTSTSTVGVFIDGVYVGANAGTALNNLFNIEGVEVLRGPQGLLFGRNVTAGAILLRTFEPSDTLKAKAEIGIESGPMYTGSAMVSGPLDSSGVWSAKIAVTASHDDGWFYNDTLKRKVGGNNSSVISGALKFRPSDDFTTILRVESGRQEGDIFPFTTDRFGKGHNHFTVTQEYAGFNNTRWQSATLESRLNVGFGDGQITNIAGFRRTTSDVGSDSDAVETYYFNFFNYVRSRQWSNELRYAGTFGPVSTTIGAFYYKDNINYFENRVTPASNRASGGIQDSETWAIFSNFDISVQSNLILTLGARYSGEHKDIQIDPLVAIGGTNPCNVVTLTCSSFSFNGKKTWNAFTPKVGFQWKPSDLTNVYGYWTRGYRSGGFNIRWTNPLAPPNAYDQEAETSFEIGIKQQTADRRGRISIAAFHNKLSNLQRDVSFFGGASVGTIQTTANIGDATFKGFEVDGSYAITPNFTLSASVGYVKAKYVSINPASPLSTSLTIPQQLALRIPFAAPWSYAVSADYHIDLGNNDKLALRASFKHTDSAAGDDLNVGYINPVNRADADITWTTADGRLDVSVYGKNLANNLVNGLDLVLPFGGSSYHYMPIAEKGRVFGAKIRYTY